MALKHKPSVWSVVVTSMVLPRSDFTREIGHSQMFLGVTPGNHTFLGGGLCPTQAIKAIEMFVLSSAANCGVLADRPCTLDLGALSDAQFCLVSMISQNQQPRPPTKKNSQSRYSSKIHDRLGKHSEVGRMRKVQMNIAKKDRPALEFQRNLLRAFWGFLFFCLLCLFWAMLPK